MTVYLVRHAVAMSRKAWDSEDDDAAPAHAQGPAPGGGARRTRSGRSRSAGCCRARPCGASRPFARWPRSSVSGSRRPTCSRKGRRPRRRMTCCTKVAAKKGDSVLCAHGDLIPELVEAVGPRRCGHRAPDVGEGLDVEARVGRAPVRFGAVRASDSRADVGVEHDDRARQRCPTMPDGRRRAARRRPTSPARRGQRRPGTGPQVEPPPSTRDRSARQPRARLCPPPRAAPSGRTRAAHGCRRARPACAESDLAGDRPLSHTMIHHANQPMPTVHTSKMASTRISPSRQVTGASGVVADGGSCGCGVAPRGGGIGGGMGGGATGGAAREARLAAPPA